MTKISNLPPAVDGTLSPDLVVPASHGGVTKKISGDQLRDLLVPAVSMAAHPSLTDAQRGLVVANVGGVARLATVSGGNAGTPGRWTVTVNDPVFNPPTQAVLSLQFVSNPADADTFTFFGEFFRFVTAAPSMATEIQIGTTAADTAANTAAVLGAFDTEQYTTVYEAPTTVKINTQDLLAGARGNTPGFAADTSDLTCNILTVGADNDMANAGAQIVYWQKNGSSTYGVSMGDICAPTAPSGTPLGGYKWPVNTTEAAANLHYALTHRAEFLAEFTASVTGNVVEIDELTAPPDWPTTLVSEGSYPYPVSIMEYSQAPKPPYVQDVVLGPLLYVRSGRAYFSPAVLWQVKLADDSDPVVFDEAAAAPGPRLLSFADNGMVRAGFLYDYNEEGYYGNGVLLALEEGGPGSTILAQRIFISGD